MSKLLFPENGAVIDTHTPIQNAFIDMIHTRGTEAALEWLLPIKNGCECSYPQPISLRWEADGSEIYTVELSFSPDFSQSRVFYSSHASLEVPNPEVGRQYWWRVNGDEAATFSTLGNTYRFMRIDGLMNVRDVGGIRLRQGLLYRGSDIEGEYTITEAGRETFCYELGIRTEINLRKEITKVPAYSAAGETVKYRRLPYRPYREAFEDEHRENICRIFEFLADAENYPVYLHCRSGADRTGMIALYLRALAGESDDEILTDYELTSLSQFDEDGVFRSRNNDYFTEFLDMLDPYAPSGTLAEKVRAFLLDCGVTEDTLHKTMNVFGV